MQPVSSLAEPNVITARPLPLSLAYGAAACVPILAAASFVSPTVSDIALAVLVLTAIWVIGRDLRQLLRPLPLLAVSWMVFVLVSALWARAEAVPGDPLHNWHKHIFIALAPFVAIACAAAWQRLGWRTDRLLTMFLAGLSVGALLLLLRNGAIGMVAELRPSDGMMGPINRNLAALACGLLIIALTGLFADFVGRLQVSRKLAWGIAVPTAMVLSGLLVLLILLRSRGGYIGTEAGLVVWPIVYLSSGALRRSRDRRGMLPIIIIIAAICSLALGSYLAMQTSGRSLVESANVGAPALVHATAAGLPELFQQILHGRFDLAYETARNYEARVQLLTLAADLFHQRPWLGWGPDAWHLIYRFSPFPDLTGLNQFHNGYAQFLVCFGVIGTGLMVVYVAALLLAAIARRRAAADPLSPPLFATAAALLTMLLVYNLSETVLLVKCAASTMMMLAALAALPIGAATRVRGSDLGSKQRQ